MVEGTKLFIVSAGVDYLDLTCVECDFPAQFRYDADIPVGGSYVFRCVNEKCKNHQVRRLKLDLEGRSTLPQDIEP